MWGMILERSDGRTRELPFLTLALAAHAAVFSLAGTRVARPRRAASSVAVEFVTELPQAPAPPTPEPLVAAVKPEIKERPAPRRRARRRLIARRRGAKRATAGRRLALKAALASIKDPDEKLSDAVAGPGSLAWGKAPAAAAIPAFAPSNAAIYDVQRDGFDPAKRGGGAGTAWSIAGPAANRRPVRQRLPRPPRRLGEQDISLMVRFEVLPDGTVRRGAAVRKSSGFPEVDRAALDAIQSWRFERLPPGVDAGPAWGDVKLKFLTE